MPIKMFQEIRKTCLTLFEDGNNSYKYIRHYREELNKYIYSNEICSNDILEISEADISEQLLFMLMIIYIEKTKTRYHTNDIVALSYEKVIIADSLTILRQDNYKQLFGAEINKLLTDKTYETYLSLFERNYGYKTYIDLELITDFTDDNVLHIYTNMNMIKKLFELNASIDENKSIEIYDVTPFLFENAHSGAFSSVKSNVAMRISNAQRCKLINQLHDYCFCLYYFTQKV